MPRSRSASTSAGARPSITSRASCRSSACGTEPRRPRTRFASRPRIRSRIGIPTDAARSARGDPQSLVGDRAGSRAREGAGRAARRVRAGARVRRIRWSQGETQVIELGSGSPLLYVHGGLGGAYEVVPILAALAESHRVLAVDRPGHGLADPFDYRGVDLLDHGRTFLRRRSGWARAPDRRRDRELAGRALVRRLRARRSEPRVAPRACRGALRRRARCRS